MGLDPFTIAAGGLGLAGALFGGSDAGGNRRVSQQAIQAALGQINNNPSGTEQLIQSLLQGFAVPFATGMNFPVNLAQPQTRAPAPQTNPLFPGLPASPLLPGGVPRPPGLLFDNASMAGPLTLPLMPNPGTSLQPNINTGNDSILQVLRGQGFGNIGGIGGISVLPEPIDSGNISHGQPAGSVPGAAGAPGNFTNPFTPVPQMPVPGLTPAATPGLSFVNAFGGGPAGTAAQALQQLLHDSGRPFDTSQLFSALAPVEARNLQDQVNALRAGAGSLGARFSTGLQQNEALLRQRALQDQSLLHAQIAQSAFENAQGRALQASQNLGQIGVDQETFLGQLLGLSGQLGLQRQSLNNQLLLALLGVQSPPGAGSTIFNGLAALGLGLGANRRERRGGASDLTGSLFSGGGTFV